jgi:hypothetical protein
MAKAAAKSVDNFIVFNVVCEINATQAFVND